MQTLSISQVARRFGLRPSALRYYEQIGILPPANRVSGRRRYDDAALRRLAIIQRARDAGFALSDIRELFVGFRPGVPASQRWLRVSQRKLAELDSTLERLQLMRDLLTRMSGCKCDALDECGAVLLRTIVAQPPRHPVITAPRGDRGR